jgi:flagellar hook-length control protein FliK
MGDSFTQGFSHLIQLSSLLPITPQGPVRPALLASAGAGSFALALGALAAEGGSETKLPGRQTLAHTGKDLPELATDDATGDEAEEVVREDGADIAFAWFAVSPVQDPVPARGETRAAPLAPAVENKEGAPRSEAESLRAFAGPASPPQGEDSVEIAVSIATPVSGEPAVERGSAKLPAPPVLEPQERADASATGDMPDLAVPKAVAPERRVPQAANAPYPVPSAATVGPVAPAVPEYQTARTSDVPAPQPGVFPPVPSPGRLRTAPAQLSAEPAPVAVPRARVMTVSPTTPIAPQIHAAIFATIPAAPAPPRRTLAVEQAALSLLPATPDAAQPQIVSAPADVQQSALDTRRQEWMGKMVEHIEALRDAAPVRETRLSFVPEALGKVEVSIRQEGERVHVHFTTETPAARQLLVDAQPRLGELAEARGLKLGQTSFESGTTGQGANRDSRNNAALQPPLVPRRAHSDSAVGAADDERIA